MFVKLTLLSLKFKLTEMKKEKLEALYKATGDLVRRHRENKMTQHKLGELVGLSRTSITNIENGRQHIASHHLFDIADALKVRPEVLLPSQRDGASAAWIKEKMPPGTEKNITEWAEKLVGE